MSKKAEEAAVHLEDFVDWLKHLDAEGLAFAVIGGMAVGAYAHSVGTQVISKDLDLFVTHETLESLLVLAPEWGATVIKRPQPRNVPVAVLDWRGHEINALTASAGLARPDVVIKNARDFELTEDELTVPLCDPFDLLANKRAVHRDKDEPHIAILEAFVREEVVADFRGPGSARARSAAARRWLEVLEVRALDDALATRLVAHANLPGLRRFLASRWPPGRDTEVLLHSIEDLEERRKLEAILKHRSSS